MAGVLFEDIFNVKDIDPEGKKFDRGKSTSEFTFRFIRASTCRGDARAIFIVRMLASRELVDLAEHSAACLAGTTSTWCDKHMVTPLDFWFTKKSKYYGLQYRETSHRGRKCPLDVISSSLMSCHSMRSIGPLY